jgi:hypothetical protein
MTLQTYYQRWLTQLLLAIIVGLSGGCESLGLTQKVADKPVLSVQQRTVAESKIALAAAYDTIASRKRRGLITDAERDSMVAQADKVRDGLAAVKGDIQATPQAILVLLEQLEARLK